jgi:hypothetical protein
VLAVLQRVPRASYLTAYLIGVGIRPEHAPPFAARPTPEATVADRRTVGPSRLTRRLPGRRLAR